MPKTELTDAMQRERQWRGVLLKVDTGSYCESPDNEGASVMKIVGLYRDLVDALMKHQRAGYKEPPHAR